MEKLQYRIEVFEGPLDLLLALIAKNKLNIYDIPISELLEQYLQQIDLMREENLDIASEFLEMAARLVQIKAASLLPRQEEEEDPRMELTGQLIEYQQCKAVAAMLSANCRFDRIVREPTELPRDYTYRRLHDPVELLQALTAAWGKGKSLLPPKPESFSALVTKKIVSVSSQVVFVLRRLWNRKKISYQALFAEKHEKSERVAAFLAVLELVKSRRVRVEGEGDKAELTLLTNQRRKGGGA